MKASLTSPSLVVPGEDHGHVAVGITGADEAVAFHAHGVAGGMQRLRPDDDRRGGNASSGIPPAKINPAEQGEQMHRVDTEAPSHTMLAIGRKDEIVCLPSAGRSRPAPPPGPGRKPTTPVHPGAAVAVASVSTRRSTPCRDRSFDLIIVAAEGVLQVFQPLPSGEQLNQLNFSARTADVAHWCILSSPDAVVPHLIGPGAGSPRWVVPPPSGALLVPGARLRIPRGLGTAPARCGCE